MDWIARVMTYRFWKATARVIEQRGFVLSRFATAGKTYNADGTIGYAVFDDVNKTRHDAPDALVAAARWDRINRSQF